MTVLYLQRHKTRFLKSFGTQVFSSTFSHNIDAVSLLWFVFWVMLIVDMTLLFISTINHRKCNSETVGVMNSWSPEEAKKKPQRLRAASALERWKQEAVSVFLTGLSCKWLHVHNMPQMMSPVFWWQYFTALSPPAHPVPPICCLFTGSWIWITSLKVLMVRVAFAYIWGKLMPL